MSSVKEEGTKDYLTSEEALEAITGLVTDALSSAAGSSSVIEATKLKDILDKVATKEAIEVRGLQGDIIVQLNRTPNGIHSTGLWTRLRGTYPALPLEAVEEALGELQTGGHVHKEEGGALPVWKLGKAPEPEKKKK